MSLKLDKHMLLVLAVLLMLVMIPTAFASDVNDTDAVGVNDAQAVDAVSVSAVSDVQLSTSDNSTTVVSASEVEKTGVNDESDVLNVGSSEIEIKPNTATVDDYSPGASQIVIFLINQGSAVTYGSDLWSCQDNFLLYVNNHDPVDTNIAPSGYSDVSTGSIQVNLNIVPTTYWNSGANSVKLGLSSDDTSMLEGWGDTVTLTPMTVNVAGSEPEPEPEDDSIWVNDATGDDTNGNGSKNNPYKSISKGITEASAGKTVKIAEGNYVLTSAITISKNIALVGVGDVNITRNGGNLFSKGTSFKGTISFTGITFRDITVSNYDAVWYDHSSNTYKGDLSFINCSFINNEAYALISATDNVLLEGCSFINNTLLSSSSNTYRPAIVFKYNGQDAKVTVNRCIFINNVLPTTGSYKEYFSDYSNGAYLYTSDTFWGTNDEPVASKLANFAQAKRIIYNWAVIDTEIDDDVCVGDNPQLTIKFKSNSTGAESLSEITGTMPNLTVSLTPTLGSVNPTTVTISNNVGTTTYTATAEGQETVTIKEGSQELTTGTFFVDESPVGKLFVDASYTGGDSDGSKDKPYPSISDALDNLGANTEIVVKKGTYTLDNYAINSNVIITGKEDDVIVNAGTAGHINIASSKTVNLTNLIFKGAATTSIVSSGILNITDCVFENNGGTNVISSTEGSVDIAYTVFNNNGVTGKIVDAVAGTVDYNFWGSNAQPDIAAALTLNNYIIINATIPSMREDDKLESELTHDINIKFLLNDGQTEIEKSLHNVTLTLTSTIGEVTDSVTIVDNEAVAHFISNDEGAGQIDIKNGDMTLKTFDFTVIERETGRIFVDASVAVTGDGSKANPYKTVQEAVADNNNDGGKEIIVYSGTYKVYNTVVSKDVTITGRGNVVFDVYDYTNDEGRYFAGYTSSTNHYLNVSNIVFINSGKQYVLQYAKDIVVDNCTFVNGSGTGGIIQPTSSYSTSGSVIVKNSAFINLTCGSTPIGNSYATTSITNSVFNNVTYSSTYLIQGSVGDINGNFWGTNAPTKLASSYTLNNWVVAVPSLDETIVQGQTKTLTVEFKNTTNGETFTDLNTVLPDVTLGLTSLLGNTFTPETITISNNIGTVTYNAVNNGVEEINLTSGAKTIETLERTVEEGDSPDKIFVDETYNGTDADGSKDKPFNNLKDAFDAITATRNNVVVLEGDYSISNYTLSNAATIRWSKKRVNITATDLKIAADVTFNNLVFKGGNRIIVTNNGGKLTVANTTFVNRTGGIVSAGDLTISESKFINTKNAIAATDGTVNVEFSEFILSDSIGCAPTVTGSMNNNYFDALPQDVGGVNLECYVALVIDPTQSDVDLNASETQTFTIAFKNTTDGATFTDLTKAMPALDIAIAPTIGSVDKAAITLSDSDSFTYTATTEGEETINLTTEGLTFATLEFDVGKSVEGKIFVAKTGSDTDGDGSRLKPFASLSKAVSSAQSGNEIVIYEGVYTESSYISAYKNLVITGEGDVVLTRTTSSYSPYLISASGGYTLTFNNLTFANVDAGTSSSSYGSVIQGPTSSYDGYATININNCTFENNTAYYSPIYVQYGYVTITQSKFINNTATGTGQGSALVYVQRGSLDISYSEFMDNDCRYQYDIFTYMDSYLTVNVNNNFWGSNDKPTKFDSNYPNSIPTTWVIVNATLDADTVNQGETATIKLTFNSTGGNAVSELENAMPDTIFDLSSILNAVDATVTISNNVAEITYDAVKYGDEAITVKVGKNALTTLEFVVEEADDGTKIFVNSSSTSTETPDGSKAKPYKNLEDALNAVTPTKNLISVAEGDDYTINGYTIGNDVEIYANKPVTINATDMIVDAEVTLKNLIFMGGNAITVNSGKKLGIFDSTFIANDGAVSSNGDLVINATKFIGNSPTDAGKHVIDAFAGSVKISYSEFIEPFEGKEFVYEATGVTTDVDNNYWYDNDALRVSTVDPTTWIKLVGAVSGNVFMDKEAEITFKFVDNNDNELDVVMPAVMIGLNTAIGSVTPNVVSVENNVGSVTYLSNVEGTETISYAYDDAITFDVVEDETGKLYVAPEDYTRDTTKTLGSKANPYTTLTAAISGATTGTEIVMLEGTYTTTSYYTINKNNLKITGRGKVVLTSSSSSQYYFINMGSSYNGLTLTNLIFENITVASGYSSYHGLIEYSGTYSAKNTLSVFNCTFNNNQAPYGMIYGSSNANLIASGNIFYNNTATYNNYNAQLIRVSGSNFDFNYNILVDNKVTYTSGYIVYGPTGQNANYNFWGSNNQPVAYKDYNQVTVNKWVVANITIDNDDLAVGDSATVTVKFIDNDGNDLAKSMPTFTFDLAKVLGEIPINVTVENNVATFTYNAIAQGDETISLKVGDKEIANITFYVDESPIGKIFVNETSTDNPDGSRNAPYISIADAIAKNHELGGNQTIILKAGEYTLSEAEIVDNVTIKAADGVTIDAEGKTALTIKDKANVTLINVNINNGVNAIVAEENTKLNIINSTFVGNNGAIVSNGATTIYRTLFKDNGVSASGAPRNGKLLATNPGSLIKADAGSLDVSYSAFVGNAGTLIESSVAATANNNFWGTNDQPTFANVDTTSWVKVEATLEGAPNIFIQREYDVNVKFVDNNGNELTDTLPDVTLDVSTTLGTIDSEVTISENKGVAKFTTNDEGQGQINVGGLVTIDINAVEDETGKIFVATPENGGSDSDGDGSKSKPYATITEALTHVSAENNIIIVMEGEYCLESSFYNVNNDVSFEGRGNVVLTKTTSTYLFDIAAYKNASFKNIIFANCTSTSRAPVFYMEKGSSSSNTILTIENCTFINNKGPSATIYNQEYGTLNIFHSNFINNTATSSSSQDGVIGSYYDIVLTANYNNFVGNSYVTNFVGTNNYVSGNLNYNYWGSNNQPTGIPSRYTMNYWVILTPTIDSDTLYVGGENTVTAVFTDDRGNELAQAMPDLTVNITSDLGTADPITISNNIGTTAFKAVAEGEGTIEFYFGDLKVAELPITAVNPLSVIVEKINEGEKLNITVNLLTKDNGTAVVTINGTDYDIEVTNGTGSAVKETNLLPGTYDVDVVFGNYANTNTTTINIRDVNLTFEIADNLQVGDKAIIKVVAAPGTVEGDITVYVNGKKYTVTKANDYTFETDELAAGEHSVVALYLGDAYHASADNSTTFNVAKKDTTLTIDVSEDPVFAGEMVTITVNVADVKGIVNITINDEDTYFVEIKDGKAILEIDTLPAGLNNITATFAGDDNYNLVSGNSSVTVNKRETTMSVYSSAGTDSINIDVYFDDYVSGTLVLLNGTDVLDYYNLGNDDEGYLSVYGLENGKYNFTVRLISDIYGTPDDSVSFVIDGGYMYVDADYEAYVGRNFTVTVDLPEDAKGNVTVVIGEYNCTVNVTGGEMSISVPALVAGDSQTIKVIYSGDEKYMNRTKTASIDIYPDRGTISYNSTITADEDAVITITFVDKNTKGKISATVDEVPYEANVTDGVGTLTIPLKSGEHDFDICYTNDDGDEIWYWVDIEVEKANLPESDIKFDENTSALSMEIPDAADGNVTFYVDGKEYAATIKDGVASAVISELTPGTHTAVAKYEGGDKYNPVTIIGSVEGPAAPEPDNNITVVVDGVEYPAEVVNGTAVVKTNGSESVTNITVVVDGVEYPAEVVNGTAVVETNGTAPVLPESVVVDGVEYPIVYVNGTAVVETNGTEPLSNITVVVDGVSYPAEVVNGTAVVETNATQPVVLKSSEFSEITISDDLSISFVLKDEDGKVIANAPITYAVNGKAGTTTTDKDGKFTIKGENGAAITVKYAGNENITGVETSLKLNSAVAPTVVKVASQFNISGGVITLNGYAVDTKAGEEGMYYATELLDANGKPISGAKIQFAVNDKIYNRTTKENGSFTPYKLNMIRAGRYTMAFYFPGNDNYTGAFASVCVDLDKKPIKIKASSKTLKANAKVKYTITLSTIVGSSHDGKAHLRVGKVAKLTVNGKTYTGKTDKKGKVTFNIKNTKKGKFTASIFVKGDTTYEEATKNVKLTFK